MQIITQIYNFYKFLNEQDIFKNQLSLTGFAVPIWEDDMNGFIQAQDGTKQSVFINGCVQINSSKRDVFHNGYFPLLSSGFGDPEYIGYFDEKFINFDEEFIMTNYGDINAVKQYNTVEQIWEEVIKPKILEFKIQD